MRTRRALLAAPLAVLLVLAGCSTATPSDDAATASPAVTPVPVPDRTPTATATPIPASGPTVTATGDIAPGLTATGVRDAIALAAAHRDWLAERSVTLERETVVRYPNESTTRLTESYRLSADRSRLSTVADTGARHVEEYVDADYRVRRRSTDGDVEYDVWMPGGSPGGPDRYAVRSLYRRSFHGLLVALDSARVTRAEGAADYRVTSPIDSLREAESPFGLDPEPGHLSALVTREGFVVGWDLRYVARTREGTPVAVTVRVRHRGVGTTEVERPPWYGEALASAGVERTPTPRPAA